MSVQLSGTLHPCVTVTDADALSTDQRTTGEPDVSLSQGLDIGIGNAAVGTAHHKTIITATNPGATYCSLELKGKLSGVILPSLTSTQRDAIPTPTAGTLIYNSTTGKLNIRVAAAWEAVTSA